MLSERLGAVHRSAAPCPPTVYTAVLSALGGLASGFGTGPGVPPLPWPLTGGRRPPARGHPPPRALRAAQRVRDLQEPVGSARAAATADHPGGPVERVKSSGD